MTNVSTAQIFHDVFLKQDVAQIASAIQNEGYFCLPGALTDQAIENLLGDVAEHPFAINRNWISGVYYERQYYQTHMLACSRTFAQYCTHPKFLSVCDHLLGERYRLKAMRYYETYGRHHMQWHTDNKTDRGFAHIPGLIFIVYLVDVEDGEFQYVRGSQRWSGERAYSDYSDEEIAQKYGQDVVSFKGKKGTIVIYDTYGIHRAKPVADASFVRKSLFFQVDSHIESAEPILLNPSFISGIDEKTQRYLGFGLPAEYQVFPHTDYRHFPITRVQPLKFAHWLTYRMARATYDFLPRSAKKVIRQLMGKPNV